MNRVTVTLLVVLGITLGVATLYGTSSEAAPGRCDGPNPSAKCPTPTPMPSATSTPASYCNLSGRTIRHGSGLRAEYLDFSQCLLAGSVWSDPSGAGTISSTTFEGSDLSGAIFEIERAFGTNFASANLTGVSLKGIATWSTNFTNANLTDADLAGATFGYGTSFYGATTTGATVQGATWYNTTCPDGTNSDNNGGTCIGHGFEGTLDPLSWWPAENNALDVVSGFDGSLIGGIGFAPGHSGQAFSLDGTSGHVFIGNPDALKNVIGAITLEAWVNPSAAPPPYDHSNMFAVLSKWGQASGLDAYGLYLYHDGANVVALAPLATNGGTDSIGFRGGVVPVGQWTHIAATYNSSTGEQVLYVNGTQVNSRQLAGNITASDADLLIGREDSWHPRPFAGLIDEVRIYNRALSAQEVMAASKGGGGLTPTPTPP